MTIGLETFVTHVQLQIILEKNTGGLYKCWRVIVLKGNIYQLCP